MSIYHSDRGSVGYTIIGTPTIQDGIVSGFSSSDYLTTTLDWFSSSNFEMSCTFTTPSDMSTMDNLCSIMTTGLGRNGLDLYRDSSNNWYLHFNFNLENSQSGGLWVTNYPLQANHTYLGKLLYDGSVYTIQLYENNNLLGQNTLSSANKPIIPTSYPKIYFGFSFYNTKVFTGSIDLNETYIKVNEKAWFGICPVEVKKIILNGNEVNQVVKDGVVIWTKPSVPVN